MTSLVDAPAALGAIRMFWMPIDALDKALGREGRGDQDERPKRTNERGAWPNTPPFDETAYPSSPARRQPGSARRRDPPPAPGD